MSVLTSIRREGPRRTPGVERTTTGVRRGLVVGLLCSFAMLMLPGLAHAGSERGYDPAFILAAGDDDRAWAITKSVGERDQPYTLFHLPPAEPSGDRLGALRRVAGLAAAPDAITARNDALVLVFPPTTGDTPLRRVREFRVQETPTGVEFIGSAIVLPHLPGRGTLLGVADTGERLHALLATEGVTRLYLLEGSGWTETALPEAIASAADARLASTPSDVAVLTTTDDETLLWRHTSLDDQWSSTPLEPLPGAQRVMLAGGRLLQVAALEDGFQVLERARGVALPDGTVASTDARTFRVEGVPATAAVTPARGDLAFLWPEGEETMRVNLRIVDAQGQTLYDDFAVMRGPVSPADVQALAIAMLWLCIVVLVFVIRTGGEREPVMPEAFALATPFKRAVAWLIDLVPGFVIVALVWPELQAAPQGLFEAAGPGGPWPLAIIVAQATIVGTIGEALAGRTLGKLLLNMRTIDYDGNKPNWWLAFSRNVVRFFVPPVAAFSVINPTMAHPQSFQTLVVVKRREVT